MLGKRPRKLQTRHADAIRRVASPAGERRYRLPEGTPITPGMKPAGAKARAGSKSSAPKAPPTKITKGRDEPARKSGTPKQVEGAQARGTEPLEYAQVSDVVRPPKLSAADVREHLNVLGIDPKPGHFDYAGAAREINRDLREKYREVTQGVSEGAWVEELDYQAANLVETVNLFALRDDARDLLDDVIAGRFDDAPDIWQAFRGGVTPSGHDGANPQVDDRPGAESARQHARALNEMRRRRGVRTIHR